MSAPTARADRVDRREIVGELLAPEPQLEALEAAFGDELARLVGERCHIGRAKARCCCRPAPRPSDPPRNTASGMLAALASASHAAMSRPDTAIIAMPSLPTRFSDFRPFWKSSSGRIGCPVRAAARSWMVDDDRARGGLQIRLQIAAADDAFLGLDIDQDDRPLIEQADFRHDRTAQRHDHRPHVHGAKRQALEHRDPLPRCGDAFHCAGRTM